MLKPLVARTLSLPGINRIVRSAAALVLPDRSLYRLPVSARRAIYHLQSGESVILLDPQRDQVAKDIVWGKGEPTSPADTRILRLIQQWSGEVSTFLDIGAYSGLFAMIAAKANPNIRAIAFEIAPENFILTWRNIIENDLAAQAEVRLCGLSDTPGTLPMPRRFSESSNPSSLSLGTAFDHGVSIPVRTLDNFAFSGPLAMKLDVEGFEWNVIKGGAKTIRQHLPKIVCEILPRFEHSAEIEGLLKPLGYRFLISLEGGLEERPALIPDRAGRDWVFMPPSR